jgi:predicted nucleotide-binding protein
MKKAVADHLEKLFDEGVRAESERELDLWSDKVTAFFRSAVGPDEADEFVKLRNYSDAWKQHALRLGHIQGLIAKAEAETSETLPAISAPTATSAVVGPALTGDSRKVFVVHGHDNEAKEVTARFLERLGLQSIILHEQPSSGRTVIEKFENYSGDIAFAVVLLTPDDVGGVATSPTSLKPRARQNVIMELGYFMGRLGRVKVCALHKGGVELPSDYQGILYIEMDSAGAWKSKLAQELVQTKLPIELSGLLGG